MDVIWQTQQKLSVQIEDAESFRPIEGAHVKCQSLDEQIGWYVDETSDGFRATDATGRTTIVLETGTIHCSQDPKSKSLDPYSDRVTGKPASFTILAGEIQEILKTQVQKGAIVTGEHYRLVVTDVSAPADKTND